MWLLERLQIHLHDKNLGMAQMKMDCLPSRSEHKRNFALKKVVYTTKFIQTTPFSGKHAILFGPTSKFFIISFDSLGYF